MIQFLTVDIPKIWRGLGLFLVFIFNFYSFIFVKYVGLELMTPRSRTELRSRAGWPTD